MTTQAIRHLSTAELEAGLEYVRQSPTDAGTIEMLVRRPASGEREIMQEAELDLEWGMLGDSWQARGSSSMPDGVANPDAQITIMNTRILNLVAQDKERWPLAGDQLLIDMDISIDNLPPGTRLAIGSAIVEITALPHTGCKKFVARFGLDAMMFVNLPIGKQLRLRGVNTRIVQPGVVRVGDVVRVV